MPINSRIRLDVELDGLTFGDLYEFVDLGRAGGVDPDTEVELTSTDPDDPRADGFGADVPLPEAVVVNLDSHGGPGANQGDGDRDPLRRRIGSDGEVGGRDDDVAEEADA